LQLAPQNRGAFSALLFTLNYHPDKSEEEIYEVYEEYERRYGEPWKGEWREHENSRDMGRRLKVGYVSPDFNTHAVGKFLEPLLSHHDKEQVEVYGYAELRREDEATERYRGYVDHWVPTRGISDEALAKRIREDGIDVLVDVAGHTSGNRLGVFARKPAPVSVTWLGYAYTTGLKAIDYFLTDAVSVPEGTEGLYSERPWRLDGPGYVYRPAVGMGEVSSLPALDRGYVTFGTLTRAVRINHRVIRVWAEILKRVPGSRLVVDSANYQDEKLCTDLAERFAAEGIERERLDLGYRSPPWDVLRGMDIGLDCFPHNSGTTLLETLYMGIPYITLAGRTSIRRLGSSILAGAGHPEWIAGTEDEYIEKAVSMAGDLEKLSETRKKLRVEMDAGPLRDEEGFTRRVEAAYREMFKHWIERETT
jgi:predicted O-linked N-acetylglucosamine transferase (SPINDLY family)